MFNVLKVNSVLMRVATSSCYPQSFYMLRDNLIALYGPVIDQVEAQRALAKDAPDEVKAEIEAYKQSDVTSYYAVKSEDVVMALGRDRTEAERKISPKDTMVAMIPVMGMMQKSYSWFYRVANTVEIARMINMADQDPTINSIVLHVSSGGGTVAGTYELAEAIRKTKTPIYVAGSDLVASAAYWISSQADKFYVTSPTTLVGSIGTVSTHMYLGEYYRMMGVTKTYITAPDSELKMVPNETEPLNEESISLVKTMLKGMNDEFLASVRKGRTKALGDSQDILDMDQAKPANVFVAKVAKSIGLVDGMRSLDEVISIAGRAGRKAMRESSKSNSNPKSQTTMSDLTPSMMREFVTAEANLKQELSTAQMALKDQRG